jgi:hypothetical protein
MVWQEIAAKQLLVESVRMVLEASGSENFSLLFPDWRLLGSASTFVLEDAVCVQRSANCFIH